MSRLDDAIAKANQLRQSNVNATDGAERSLPPTPGPKTWNRRWWYGVAISLALIAGFGIYRYAGIALISPRPKLPAAAVSGISHPGDQHPTHEKSSPRKNRLPTVIPLNSPDAGYSSTHPGWQRYISNTLEYRVFREENTVKAIQVLCRQGNMITVDFFTSFLIEIAGRDSFKVQSREKKDEYYIEKGTAGDRINVVVYRKMPAKEIRAFVVSYLP